MRAIVHVRPHVRVRRAGTAVATSAPVFAVSAPNCVPPFAIFENARFPEFLRDFSGISLERVSKFFPFQLGNQPIEPYNYLHSSFTVAVI
jgi:hypothetical protein